METPVNGPQPQSTFVNPLDRYITTGEVTEAPTPEAVAGKLVGVLEESLGPVEGGRPYGHQSYIYLGKDDNGKGWRAFHGTASISRARLHGSKEDEAALEYRINKSDVGSGVSESVVIETRHGEVSKIRRQEGDEPLSTFELEWIGFEFQGNPTTVRIPIDYDTEMLQESRQGLRRIVKKSWLNELAQKAMRLGVR